MNASRFILLRFLSLSQQPTLRSDTRTPAAEGPHTRTDRRSIHPFPLPLLLGSVESSRSFMGTVMSHGCLSPHRRSERASLTSKVSDFLVGAAIQLKRPGPVMEPL